MNFLERIGFKSQKPITPGESLPPVTIQYARRTLSTGDADIRRVYEQSSVIQAAVNAWTSEFTSASLKPYVAGAPSDLGHLQLFGNQIMRDLLFAMLMSGTGILYKIRSESGQVVKVQVLNGFNCLKVYDNKGVHTHWSYRTNQGEYILSPNDIVTFPWFSRDWVEKDLGLSPIGCVLSAAQQMLDLNDFTQEQIANDGVPRTILSAPAALNMTQAQMKTVLEQVRDEFKNNNGSIKVLSGGWTISRLALGLDELDITALRSIPESDIASSFRVPIEYLGTATGNANSTYANKETSRKQFVQNVVASMWSSVEQIINDAFSWEFPSKPEWWFEKSEVSALQEDQQAKFQRVASMYQSNVISRREFRAAMDLDDIDNGVDLYFNDILNQDPLA